MAVILPPSPVDSPFGSYNWADWYEKVRRAINDGSTIKWSQIATFDPGGILPVSLGGTGQSAPALVAGTNIAITGTWPNQTITGTTTTISGNAATATKLQTARTINGVSFDGTANITVTAAAGTLTGATLAAGVTASSLTSVGTLAGLAVGGQITAVSGATGTPSAIFTTGGPNQGQIRLGNSYFLQGGDDYAALNALHGGNTLFTVDSSSNFTFGASGQTCPVVLITGNASRPQVKFTSNGQTWSTALKVDAGQNYYMISNPAETVGVYMTPSASGWNNLSDERAKENWLPITDAVVKLNALDVGTFSWVKDPTLPRDVGVKAQQVLTVQPEAVDTSNPEAFGVRYTHLVPILIKAVQELSARITELEAHIAKE
jgi:Chaperone of endosialidase